MSDLLAKCDWDEDELHVYVAEWPDVVYVWVDEKTMPYAPVVADVRSLQAENAKLRELAKLAVHSACFGCPHNDKNAWRSCGGCNLYEYSTELGIEANG